MSRSVTIVLAACAVVAASVVPPGVGAQEVDCDDPDHLLTAALVQEIRLLRRDLLASRAAALRADALMTRLRSQQEVVQRLSDRVEGVSREELAREARMSGVYEEERQRLLRRRLATTTDDSQRLEIESELRMLELRQQAEEDRRAEQGRLNADLRNRLSDERARLGEILDEIDRLGDGLLRGDPPER